MGAKRLKKLFDKPRKLWDKQRVETESGLKDEFGLKNSRELWRMQTILRKIRREARRILSKKGSDLDERTTKLIKRVNSFLIAKPDFTVDEILGLKVQDLLSRRLETLIVKKGMAKTMKQARQYIVHGHVSIKGRKVSSPSYLVKFDEENEIGWFKKPLVVEASA
ncbi:30S ribosomal protein S4 [Candidatus Micrarchaeota archaeon]|nr:30S ribosomal protein S4 [Candidatus Micrarchaeota archaeon]